MLSERSLEKEYHYMTANYKDKNDAKQWWYTNGLDTRYNEDDDFPKYMKI
jgi:hypothetical protein